MKKYYRVVDSTPYGSDNISALIKMGAVHYSTMRRATGGVYRNFVMKINEEELLVARLSLSDVSIEPLSKSDYNFLKSSGYIK